MASFPSVKIEKRVCPLILFSRHPTGVRPGVSPNEKFPATRSSPFCCEGEAGWLPWRAGEIGGARERKMAEQNARAIRPVICFSEIVSQALAL